MQVQDSCKKFLFFQESSYSKRLLSSNMSLPFAMDGKFYLHCKVVCLVFKFGL
jgi:hypothetical protein